MRDTAPAFPYLIVPGMPLANMRVDLIFLARFVTCTKPKHAEAAIARMDGFSIGHKRLKGRQETRTADGCCHDRSSVTNDLGYTAAGLTMRAGLAWLMVAAAVLAVSRTAALETGSLTTALGMGLSTAAVSASVGSILFSVDQSPC